MLLKYKLNNVCDADHRYANGAKRTMIVLIYYNILWLSIQKCQNDVLRREHSHKHNTHYLRIKCVLQAHHENNAYCVRIKGVLVFNKVCPFVCKQFLLGLQAMEKT